MIQSARAGQRGISLLEALVALVVMSVGAVAVVGLQSGLRLNGDVAKQRSEALRLGQDALEDARTFKSLSATAATTDWGDLTDSSTTITPANSNASYTRQLVVQAFGATDDDPLFRTLQVTVTWDDRASQAQSLALNSWQLAVSPEFAGSASVPLTASIITNKPFGRHAAIPPAAVDDSGGGTSSFSPPGSSGLTWRFDNATGVVIQVCEAPSPCSDVVGFLVSGYVSFATGSAQPSAAQAENPPSGYMPVELTIDQDAPVDTGRDCFEQYNSSYVAYYCLVLATTTTPSWTGRLDVATYSLPISSSMSDNNPSRFKVCRYTPIRNNSTTAGSTVSADFNGDGTLESRKAANSDHLYYYNAVTESLSHQNFLVIRAGDGSNAFTCPDDNTSTTTTNTATWRHQPDS